MGTCIVSFVDTLGFRHTVEVQAESLFEAGVLAIHAFKQCNCPPGYVTELEVEIRSQVKPLIVETFLASSGFSASSGQRDRFCFSRPRSRTRSLLEI